MDRAPPRSAGPSDLFSVLSPARSLDLLRVIANGKELLEVCQSNLERRSIAVLCHIGTHLIYLPLFLGLMQQDHHVGVGLDRARLAEVRERRLPSVSLLGPAVDLAHGDNRDSQLSG